MLSGDDRTFDILRAKQTAARSRELRQADMDFILALRQQYAHRKGVPLDSVTAYRAAYAMDEIFRYLSHSRKI